MSRTPYTLQLTADEYRTLDWMEHRGYSADLIKHATTIEDGVDDNVVLRYSEPDAWQVNDKAHESRCTKCDALLDWSGRAVDIDDDPDCEHEPSNTGEPDCDFGTCAPASLLGKIITFVTEIV